MTHLVVIITTKFCFVEKITKSEIYLNEAYAYYIRYNYPLLYEWYRQEHMNIMCFNMLCISNFRSYNNSHPTVFTFRSWLDLLDVVLAFWISILKISKLLQNCLHRVIDITSFVKHLESSLDRTPNFCLNLVIFRSKNMYLKESLTRSSTVI